MTSFAPIYTAPEISTADLNPRVFAVFHWADARPLIDHPSTATPDDPFEMTLELMQTADPETTDAVVKVSGAPRRILERMPATGGYLAQADLTDQTRERISRALSDLLDHPYETNRFFVDDGYFESDTEGAEGYLRATIAAHVAGGVLEHLSLISNHRLLSAIQAPELRYLARARAA